MLAHGHGGARRLTVLEVKQLQSQALGHVARAHAGRLHVVEQLQGNGKVLLQLFGLGQVTHRKARSQRGQTILQIAIVVERFNQKVQGGAVNIRQPQAQ